jgi:hypothetical protein
MDTARERLEASAHFPASEPPHEPGAAHRFLAPIRVSTCRVTCFYASSRFLDDVFWFVGSYGPQPVAVAFVHAWF